MLFRFASYIFILSLTFPWYSALALEPLPSGPTHESPDSTSNDQNDDDSELEVPGGIVNPNFIPDCEYTQGVYECEDFATSYCEQFPTGRGDCRIIGFCGFPDKGCHAANITRVKNADGTYTYCMVEPQTNTAIPGSCWVGDEKWPRVFPPHLHPAICDYYESEELQCVPTPHGPRLPSGPIRPYIRPKVPWTWTSVSPVGSSSTSTTYQ